MELLYLLFIVLGLDRVSAEHVLCAFLQTPIPILNMSGVNIELLGQFRQGAFALHGRQSYLGH